MKTIFVCTAVLSVVCLIGHDSFAADKKGQVRVNANLEAEKQLRIQKNQQAMTQASAVLGAKEWLVTFIPDSEPGAKKVALKTDMLTVKDGRVSAKGLLARGYQESNYTMSVMNDGTVIWETMQKSKLEGGVLFLRGELRGDVLTGFMTLQPAKGKREDYSFTSGKV
ncbi:MAG: hypothetical protein KBA46_05205 [Candidatus Omnitrophica bacterium]|nr:hypothetical protein [Candidatus Omnitrophota bacterium]